MTDALRAAENDSKHVVLVYGSDDAIEVPELVPIPEPLKVRTLLHFVGRLPNIHPGVRS